MSRQILSVEIDTSSIRDAAEKEAMLILERHFEGRVKEVEDLVRSIYSLKSRVIIEREVERHIGKIVAETINPINIRDMAASYAKRYVSRALKKLRT